MFLHSIHASNHHQDIVIKSSDTDVEMLACHLQSSIPARIVINSGTRSRSRLINIPDLCERLGDEVCKCLPGLHALTGCDTVSAFAGKGKTKAFQLIVRSPHFRSIVENIRETVPITEEDVVKLEEFVCSLYGKPGKSVNGLRYDLFCKAKNLQSHHLPPTQAALRKHIQRANYQAAIAIWKKALEANPRICSPNGHGWHVKDDTLTVDWTDQVSAPEAVLEIVSCNCNTSKCETQRCSCVKNHLPCSDVCGCVNCLNTVEETSGDDESDEDSDHYYEDDNDNDMDIEEDEDVEEYDEEDED